MFQFLRKATQTWAFKGLLIILMLSFGVWGVGDYVTSSGDQAAPIRVGDQISYSADFVRQRLDEEVDRLRSVAGPGLTRETALAMGILGQVVDNLVNEGLMMVASTDLRLSASDDAVRGYVRSLPIFQGEDGRFSPDRFAVVLTANQMTEQGYINLVRRDLVSRRFTGALAGAPAIPEAMLQPLYQRLQERRAIEMVRIPFTALENPGTPTDEQLKEVYDANLDRFSAPAYRGFTGLLLSTGGIAERIAIGDQQIADHYRDNIADYTTPEQRAVSQAVFATEEEAREVAERVRSGTAFAEAAAGAQVPHHAMGEVQRDDLPGAQADTVFALTVGAISEPVQSPIGWHLFQVTAVEPPSTKALDEVRDTIRQSMAEEQAFDTIYQLSTEVEDRLAGGATLEDVARGLDLPLLQVAAADRQGRTPEGEPVEGLPAGSDILGAVFSQQQGEQGLLREYPGGYFVVRADTVQPPAPRPLEDVREQVAALWTDQQRRAAAETLAQELAERARGGAPMAELAATREGLETVTSPPVDRSGRSQDGALSTLSRPILQELFQGGAGTVASGTVDGAMVVARVAEVVEPPPAAESDFDERLARELRTQMENDLLTQFTLALRQRYEVTVNEQALAQAFGGQ